MPKKIPMRMCVVTRERYAKNDLIRIVNTVDGIKVDLTGKVNGKGCYLKKDSEVVLKAKKIKALDRVFETTVDDCVYDEILNIIK